MRADDNVRTSVPHLEETRARLAMDRKELDTSDHKNIVEWRQYADGLRGKDKLTIVQTVNSEVNKRVRYEGKGTAKESSGHVQARHSNVCPVIVRTWLY